MVTWFTLSTVTSDPPGCGDCDNCDNVKLGKSGFLIKGWGGSEGNGKMAGRVYTKFFENLILDTFTQCESLTQLTRTHQCDT